MVNYAAIIGEKISDMEGALQALYKLEEIYGLYPTDTRRSKMKGIFANHLTAHF